MTRQDGFLRVSVVEVGKTYVGGTFCNDEEAMLKYYSGNADACEKQEVSQARKLVAAGVDPETALERLCIKSSIRQQTIGACLVRIANGQCAVMLTAEQ